MVNLVNLENVSKSFGVKPLLDGVSLGVQEGERIGINAGSQYVSTAAARPPPSRCWPASNLRTRDG